MRKTVKQSETGYFGNEASESTFYAAVAIIFVVPPTGSKGRRALIESASCGFGTSEATGDAETAPPPAKRCKGVCVCLCWVCLCGLRGNRERRALAPWMNQAANLVTVARIFVFYFVLRAEDLML